MLTNRQRLLPARCLCLRVRKLLVAASFCLALCKFEQIPMGKAELFWCCSLQIVDLKFQFKRRSRKFLKLVDEKF